MKPIIKPENAQVTYNPGKENEFKALQGVDGEIYPGEYIILFGPSGCGKSTLLYSILGILPVSGGKMVVKGDSIYDYTSQEMVEYQRSTIGIVYQSFNLIPSLSVIDNVALPQIFSGVETVQRQKRAMELLERFGVDHIADKLTTNLSGGQMQRVAVARSLVNNPEILLGDEPIGNLDTVSAKQVMDKLDEINIQDGKTVILVTHDAKWLPYAHRVYYLNEGKIVRDVPNPEKKQLAKTGENSIVTEVETLAKLFPYASIPELKVRSIINYLTQEINFRELGALERAVEEFVDGKMEDERFLSILQRSALEGGVGLDEKRAMQLTWKITSIINQSRDVSRFRDELEDDAAFFHQHKYIERIKRYLLDTCPSTITKQQQKLLEQFISDRLSGTFKPRIFEAQLYKKIEEGGVGLDTKSAIAVARYLEKLIVQGVSYEEGGEEYIQTDTEQT